MLFQPFCSFYRIFLYFGLLVQTRSRPYGLCHRPYTLAYIKGFGSPVFHVYASFLLCFMLVLSTLVLGFAMLDTLSGFVVVWLHSTPMRPCLDVTNWDALLWCQLLCAHLSPFSLRATIAYHAFLCHLLALCASLHACLHVHAWVLLVSVSSMLQHNENMDIRSKPTFVLRGCHLFVCFLACLPFACYLLSYLFAPFLICLLASCMLCLSLLSCLFVLHPFAIIYASIPFHCSLAGFLSLPLHVHIWSEDT